jgi:Ser/Thr protein kinase RdoA (MazF antagonist)
LAERAAAHWAIIIDKPKLTAQRENIIFRVSTTRGPHALRLHRSGYHKRERVLSELMWMDRLGMDGFTVPTPAATSDGSFLAVVTDMHEVQCVFSLLKWLPGEPFGASARPLRFKAAERAKIMTEIGRKLARLHAISDAWTLPSTFDRPAWDRNGLIGENPFWGRFWEAGFLSTAEQHIMLALRDFCLKALNAYHTAGADYGLIHADLARENILVDEGRVSFIDYDDCGFGYRIFDVATALIKNIHEADYDALQRSLIEGYASVRPLPQRDLDALPLALLLRSLTYIGWVDARIEEEGMREKAQRFLADVEYLSRPLVPGLWR